jgi:hypothetical protein
MLAAFQSTVNQKSQLVYLFSGEQLAGKVVGILAYTRKRSLQRFSAHD